MTTFIFQTSEQSVISAIEHGVANHDPSKRRISLDRLSLGRRRQQPRSRWSCSFLLRGLKPLAAAQHR